VYISQDIIVLICNLTSTVDPVNNKGLCILMPAINAEQQ